MEIIVFLSIVIAVVQAYLQERLQICYHLVSCVLLL